MLFPKSYIIPFWEFCFLPLSVHAQINVIYLTLLSCYSRFFNICRISLLVNILQFSFSLSYTRPKILLYTFLSKMFNYFLSLFVSVQVSDAYVNVLSIVVFFSLNFSFFDMFSFLKTFCSIHYVLLPFFILSCKSISLLLSSLSITPKYLKFSTHSICNFLFSNVLFYFSSNCFSFPLSYLSFLGLSVVQTFRQCFPFLQNVFLLLLINYLHKIFTYSIQITLHVDNFNMSFLIFLFCSHSLGFLSL